MITVEEYEEYLTSFIQLQSSEETTTANKYQHRKNIVVTSGETITHDTEILSWCGTWSIGSFANNYPLKLVLRDPIRLTRHTQCTNSECQKEQQQQQELQELLQQQQQQQQQQEHGNEELRKEENNIDEITSSFEMEALYTECDNTVISGTTAKFILIQLHVCYDIVYQVPVMCIDAYDGFSGSPISLTQMYQYLPVNVNTNNPINAYITQVEHPYTEKPIFMIHPCRTSETMHILLHNQEKVDVGNKTKDRSYFIVWLHLQLSSLGIDINILNYTNMLLKCKSS
jgi:hypothetical protein